MELLVSYLPYFILHFPYSIFPYSIPGHFRVKSTGRHGVYKFQSVAQPDSYLGYVDGFIVGYVSTPCCYGDECIYEWPTSVQSEFREV